MEKTKRNNDLINILQNNGSIIQKIRFLKVFSKLPTISINVPFFMVILGWINTSPDGRQSFLKKYLNMSTNYSSYKD